MSHDFKFDPLHAAVPQGGFSKEKGGNLRDHNGCVQGPGTASTTHYDGDYGISSANGGLPYTPGPTGGGGLPSPGVDVMQTTPIRRESPGIGKGPRR